MLSAQILGGLLQKRPKVPTFQGINAQDEQNKAVLGNSAILPEIISQTNDINAAQFASVDKMLAQASGGVYARLRDKALANTESLLNGGDVTDVLRGTAAANLYRGVAGTGFGLSTSIKNSATQAQANRLTGFDSLQRWLAGVDQTYQPVSVGAMFARNSLTPQDQIGFAVEERNAQFQRDWVNNQLKAQYAPGTIAGQAIVKTDDQITGMVAGLLGSGAGGGGGGLCCFIFLEAYNGKLPWFVRAARDIAYVKYPQVAKGYCKMAKWLVPAMRKSKIVRWLVNKTMVLPLTRYGGYKFNATGYERCRKYRLAETFWFSVWGRRLITKGI